jgi:hypothetical protein
MKLTPAQKALYEDLQKDGSVMCHQSYSPARMLVQMGLAEAKSCAYETIKLTLKASEGNGDAHGSHPQRPAGPIPPRP